MAWLTVCSVATNAIRERNVNDNVCRRLYTMWLDGEYILEARRDWMAFVKRIHKSFELSFYWLHFSEPKRIIKMIFKTKDTFLINSDCMLLPFQTLTEELQVDLSRHKDTAVLDYFHLHWGEHALTWENVQFAAAPQIVPGLINCGALQHANVWQAGKCCMFS